MYSRAQELGGGSSSLVSTDSSASSSMRRIEYSVSPLNSAKGYYTKDGSTVHNEMISSPEEAFYANFDQSQRQLQTAHSNSPSKKVIVGVSISSPEEIASPVSRRDPNNRKWVRQMTKRIKGFVTNSSSFVEFDPHPAELSHNERRSIFERKNFGLPLEKCESSSFSIVFAFLIVSLNK